MDPTAPNKIDTIHDNQPHIPDITPNVSPPPQTTKLKLTPWHIALIIIAVLTSISLIFFNKIYYFYKPQGTSLETTQIHSASRPTEETNPQPTAIQPSSASTKYQESDFTVQENTLWYTTSVLRKALITEIYSEISEMKIGPDGDTLHLRFLDNRLNTCSFPLKYLQPPPSGFAYPSLPIPLSEIENRVGRESGFVKNSDYFMFIQYTDNQDGTLYYETNGIIHSISLPNDIKRHNCYQRKTCIVYPRTDSVVFHNNQAIFSDTTFHLRIDFPTQSSELLLFTEQGAGRIIPHPTLNLAIILYQFEGQPNLTWLYDLSQTPTKIVSLEKLGSTYTNDLLDIDRYEWTPIGVKINTIEVDPYWQDNAILKPMEYYYALNDKPTEIHNEEKETEALLINSNKYLQVKCILDPAKSGYQGSTFGCYGVKSFKSFIYTSEKGVEVVQ